MSPTWSLTSKFAVMWYDLEIMNHSLLKANTKLDSSNGHTHTQLNVSWQLVHYSCWALFLHSGIVNFVLDMRKGLTDWYMALIALLVGQMFYKRLLVLISVPRDASVNGSTNRYSMYISVTVQNSFPDRQRTHTANKPLPLPPRGIALKSIGWSPETVWTIRPQRKSKTFLLSPVPRPSKYTGSLTPLTH
jgi:hypothetical protein